jgi:Integrase core domain/leucine-zipper of insertion element IS481
VSRQCAHRWLTRFDRGGFAALAHRSSRPRTSPRRTRPEREAEVVALRVAQRRGQDWIGAEVGLPARTVSRILRRHRLPYLRHCDPLTGQLVRASKTTGVRYERHRPGELVHMDVKKLGRIPAGGGWRAHGRPATSAARDRTTRVGFDYVHSLIDDHSRLAYSEVLADEKGATCAGFLTRAAGYFTAHNIPRIQRVMTDNVGRVKDLGQLLVVVLVRPLLGPGSRPGPRPGSGSPGMSATVDGYRRSLCIRRPRSGPWL